MPAPVPDPAPAAAAAAVAPAADGGVGALVADEGAVVPGSVTGFMIVKGPDTVPPVMQPVIVVVVPG